MQLWGTGSLCLSEWVKELSGHLSKKANRYLRWGMIEAAQKAKVIDSFLRAKAEKIHREKGASVATVAVARHLLVAVYHILKEKTVYRPSKLKYNSPGKPVLTLVA